MTVSPCLDMATLSIGAYLWPYPDHGLAALVKLDAAYIIKAYAHRLPLIQGNLFAVEQL